MGAPENWPDKNHGNEVASDIWGVPRQERIETGPKSAETSLEPQRRKLLALFLTQLIDVANVRGSEGQEIDVTWANYEEYLTYLETQLHTQWSQMEGVNPGSQIRAENCVYLGYDGSALPGETATGYHDLYPDEQVVGTVDALRVLPFPPRKEQQERHKHHQRILAGHSNSVPPAELPPDPFGLALQISDHSIIGRGGVVRRPFNEPHLYVPVQYDNIELHTHPAGWQEQQAA